MARPLRLEFPGAFYLVTNKGNSSQHIFMDDKDRSTFLNCTHNSSDIYGVRTLAYVLMPDSFKMVIKTKKSNLSDFMRHLLVTYTVRFNRRHERIGHLFHGRYQSVIVEPDNYLMPLIRHLHLTPVTSNGLSESDFETQKEYLKNFKWSSYPGYCHKTKRCDYLDYAWLLKSRFSGDTPNGRRKFNNFMVEALKKETDNPMEKVFHQSILGSKTFIEKIRKKVTDGNEREIPALRNLRRSRNHDTILGLVLDYYKISEDDVLSRRTKNKTARQMSMELCYRYCNKTQKEIGSIFGVDYSTVSQNRKQFSGKMKEDVKLQKVFNRLSKKAEKL